MAEEEVQLLDFTSGGSAAEEYKKKEDAARAAARGNSQYLSLKEDGDTVILRFLFDSEPDGTQNHGWIWTKQHTMAHTKAAPKDKPDDRKWPEKVTAICRCTPVGADQHPAYPNCFICDNVKNDRGQKEWPVMHLWAGAVLRERVVVDQNLIDQGRAVPEQLGQTVIIDQMDLVDEVDENRNTTGRKVWKRRYVIVNQRIDNFFGPLVTAGKLYGTILDRDYVITRVGVKGQRGVQFRSAPLDPYEVTVMRDGQPVTIKYDLREPEIAAIYANSGVDRLSLMKMINRKVSDAFYGRFFDTRVEVPWKEDQDDEDTGAPATPPPPSAAQQAGKSITQEPTQGVTADKLAEMRNRILNGNAGPATSPAPTAAAPAAVPAAPVASVPPAVIAPAPVTPAPVS